MPSQLGVEVSAREVPRGEPAYHGGVVVAARDRCKYLAGDASAIARATGLFVLTLEGEAVGGSPGSPTPASSALRASSRRLAVTEFDAMDALQARGLRRGLIEQAVEEGFEGSDLGWLITYAPRRQLGAVARRESTANLDAAQAGEEVCVGFVDLSDFTALSRRTELDAIGGLLHTFESLASNVIAETPGRVVKLIGDEVMFVCPESGAATRAALQILEGCADTGLPAARSGLAQGRVLRQGGDYFGTPVNRASRITQVAAPGTVLVDDAVRGRLAGIEDLHLEPAGEPSLKGLGATRLYRVTGSTERRAARPSS